MKKPFAWIREYIKQTPSKKTTTELRAVSNGKLGNLYNKCNKWQDILN